MHQQVATGSVHVHHPSLAGPELERELHLRCETLGVWVGGGVNCCVEHCGWVGWVVGGRGGLLRCGVVWDNEGGIRGGPYPHSGVGGPGVPPPPLPSPWCPPLPLMPVLSLLSWSPCPLPLQFLQGGGGCSGQGAAEAGWTARCRARAAARGEVRM